MKISIRKITVRDSNNKITIFLIRKRELQDG